MVNGASFQNSPAAPGSYITINGQNLTHVTANYVTANLPLAMAAIERQLRRTGGRNQRAGHLSYISPTQINVQVPWEVQGNRRRR